MTTDPSDQPSPVREGQAFDLVALASYLASQWDSTFGGDLSICRLLNGMWQVAGGHGRIDPARAVGGQDR